MADAESAAAPLPSNSGNSAATAAPSSTPPPTSQYRPSPVRSFTVGNPYLTSVKGGRAASQPPGDRLPTSSPASGRGSPGMNGGDFGVIGGSRTPTASGRVSSSGGSIGFGSVPVRASSFSVADTLEQRPSSLVRTLSSHVEERNNSRPSSPSLFPTFSPTSSPATSPTMSAPQGLPNAGGQYSPPIAPANVSRSRSQSLATGVRPDRTFMMPLSTFENQGSKNNSQSGGFRVFEEGWRKDGSNMSPFTSGGRNFFEGDEASRNNHAAQVASSFRTPQEATFGSRAWASPTTTALTTSVANALGSQPTYSSVVGGFEDTANGGRSGTSSRRHSVSVVGGGPRRGFSFQETGQGMSSLASGRRGIGSLGFTDDELLPERFGNALNLQVDDRKPNSEDPVASSLPIFNPALGDRPAAARSNPSDPFFGSSPAGKDQERGRFKYADRSKASSFSVPRSSSPEGMSERPNASGAPPGRVVAAPGSGAIGGPIPYEQRFGAPPSAPSPTAGTGFPRGPFSNPPPPMGGPTFGRPPAGFGYFGGIGQPPPVRAPFPQNGGFGGMGPGFPMGFNAPPPNANPGGNMPGTGFPPNNYFGGGQQQQPPSAPPPQQQQAPTSPSSFSSLSLADLGKGIPLASLPPTTPLYIVTFKAGRRDVFYCPDPTLLISNGDRVIVEADRGSDLGTVVFDQLTPVDVRDWQERQATAALLSGASQHQPPGMAMAGAGATGAAASGRNGSARAVPHGSSDFTGADLNTLLSGVGPSGSQMDMGGGGIGARGPLAKEIMPKRIFTKSSGGPEEQARMMDKLKEEYDAMMICREKVAQRGLPMQIVDAEYQWDRRKLTFYFKADKRVDFRELTKENFRIFKSRIWMSMVPKEDPRG